MSRELAGATVNASGTKIATAKAMGTNPLNTANPVYDSHTLVAHGGMSIPVSKSINMGHLQRNAAGAMEELNPPQPATRVG